MRLFFGFDLAPGDKSAIGDWRDRYGRAEGRPVPPANFHITLAFLGDVERRQLEPLCDRVDAWRESRRLTAMTLALDRVGYWPSPGIYWIGTGADTAAIAAIAQGLQGIGQAFGARRERSAYVPHVTLYRRCDAAPPTPVREPDIPVTLTDISLFESRRGRNAVAYTPIAEWPL